MPLKTRECRYSAVNNARMSRTEYKYTELERLESYCRQLLVHNRFYSKGCRTPLHKYCSGNEDNFRRNTVVCTAANILQQDIYLFNGSCCRKVAATAVDTRRWLELIPSTCTVVETDDQPMAGPMHLLNAILASPSQGMLLSRCNLWTIIAFCTTFHLTRP